MQKSIVTLLLLLTSCTGSNDAPSEEVIQLPPAFVTGLRLTSNTGPEVMGIWGNPSDSEYLESETNSSYKVDSDNSSYDVQTTCQFKMNAVEPPSLLPQKIILSCPYPNPARGSCVINFRVPKKCSTKVWLVQAQWIGTILGGKLSQSNLSSVTTSNYVEIFSRSSTDPGMYSIMYDPDKMTRFFRIYLIVDGKTECWRDLLVFKEKSELPDELRQKCPWMEKWQ